MKLFKLESPIFDEGFAENMKATGVLKTTVVFVNINEIESVREVKGPKTYKIFNSFIDTKITMVSDRTHFDGRSIEDLLSDLAKFEE